MSDWIFLWVDNEDIGGFDGDGFDQEDGVDEEDGIDGSGVDKEDGVDSGGVEKEDGLFHVLEKKSGRELIEV
ncbi:hypothetical protein NL676_029286 [Syzygium grande]|nr:hypothetical protein NL676_029286 [Syzygium grande]